MTMTNLEWHIFLSEVAISDADRIKQVLNKAHEACKDIDIINAVIHIGDAIADLQEYMDIQAEQQFINDEREGD